MSETQPPAEPSQASQASQPAPASPAGWRASRLFAWLQLLRVPNLLTVPGDPIAGFLLAQAALGAGTEIPVVRPVMAAIASVLIYAAGLLWNDLFDLPEDRRDRPSRPLPSGRVRVGAVKPAAIALTAAAVAAAALANPGRNVLYVVMALGIVVIAYDWRLKRIPLVGPLAMGCCRGLSVLLGAAVLGPAGLASPPAIAAAAGITLYVAAVTWLARGETRQRPVVSQRAAIAAAFVAWLAAVGVSLHLAGRLDPDWRWAMLLLAALATLWLTVCLLNLSGLPEPKTVQRTVGGLILVQATLVLVNGWAGLNVAIALLLAFLINRRLGRVFYAS